MGTHPQGCAIEVNLEDLRVLFTVRSAKNSDAETGRL